MEINIDQTKWYDRIWAAFIFFTRLPFWRFHKPPKECYRTVVEHWPLVGWLTGGVMAATFYLCSFIMPLYLALLVAVVVRLLMTGALHEDGLCDFFDGFGGGGKDRQRILDIMKDPHIGTYGVLALVCYLALLFASLYAIATSQFSDLSSQLNIPLGGLGGSPSQFSVFSSQLATALVIFAADAYSKMLASQIIMFLPYARTEQTAKNKTVYRKMSVPAGISLFLQGILPLLPLLYIGTVTGLLRWDLLVFIPCLVMYFLYYMMMRRLRGYTGDCCGALFLLIELSFYLTTALQLFTP